MSKYDEAITLLQSAQINLENTTSMIEALETNPIYKIAKEQLDLGIEKLLEEE